MRGNAITFVLDSVSSSALPPHGSSASFGGTASLVKTRLIFWLSIELLLATGFSACVCILRRDERYAFRAWRDSPTPETRAALDRERAITFRHHVVLAAVLFAGMAVITIPVVRVVSRRRDSDIENDAQNAAEQTGSS